MNMDESEKKMNRLGKRSLQSLNKEIQTIVQHNRVNHLKMIVAAEPKSKLSVTLHPMHETLDSYHGLHPNFNDRLLRLFLNDLQTNSDIEFWTNVHAIQKNLKLMNLIVSDDNPLFTQHSPSKEELEISLLGKAILHSASHFAISLQMR